MLETGIAEEKTTRSAIKSVEDLSVWQEARVLVKMIYTATLYIPSEEKFGLIAQMRRSAVSIPSNIAEGFERNSLKEYLYHLSVAQGSASELRTHIILCADLELLPYSEIESTLAQVNSVGKLLRRLEQALRKKL